jgi:hypothetical protein
MRCDLLNDPEDLAWLRSAHLREVQDLPEFKSAVIWGSEDSPEKVEIYADADPLWTDTPLRTLCQCDDGHIR